MRALIFFFVFCRISGFSQVHDNFSDSNFTANPVWLGNTSAFTVNSSQQLQLNGSGADTSVLYVANNFSLKNAEWKFWVRLAFSPSDNNLARIYLVADQTNLKGLINGYYIRLGENGSFDSIDLWKQTGASDTKIIDGINGHAAKTNNLLSIKVLRDSIGNWDLYADTLGGSNYILQGSVMDSTHKTTNYFGVYCKYTLSNANKFYFDDISVGPIVVDTVGPAIDSVNVISANTIDVYFNEPLETVSAQTAANYNVDNGVGIPSAAFLNSTNQQLIHLTFPVSFVSGQHHIVSVNGVKDLIGNANNNIKDTFFFYEALPFDIVINELMVDPDPPVGLPNYEYIELHNTSPFPVKFSQWKITVGTNTKIIPTFVLASDSFVVLTSSSGATALAGIARTIAVSGFPALTNSGQTIILTNETGRVISAVSYKDAWYRDADKKEGGFSLEQIDPLNPCAGEINWMVSAHTLGGTPGKKNSVNAPNSDNQGPYIKQASIIDSLNIKIVFNEPLDSISTANTSNYTISNGIGNPVVAVTLPPFYSTVTLTFANALQPKTVYTVSLTSAITDCKGNVLPASTVFKIAIPETPLHNDMVINEILYDPYQNGVEFVEIYNRSEKIIELKNLRISQYDTLTHALSNTSVIAPEGFLMFPYEYKLLSTNTNTVKAHYYTPAADNVFIQMNALPTLNNSGDVIILSDTLSNVIDKLAYTPAMHYPLLKETKGISLERIDFFRPSNDLTNWHSAATSVNATPGYKNSQHAQYTGNALVGVSPEIFSPDNDGYNDVLIIKYSTISQGYTGNISIYNSNGILIKNLVHNELLADEGEYSWDGTDENRQKSPIGIYIVYFEAFNMAGNVEKYKIPCVLGGKL